ncbi:MAG: hypothetical protein E7462_03735 [Ruminococcaceae bacterium]|nr:hypothetical protein [Oscillospiraceae bacterium]
MPANYAHYRMANALLPTFPADICRTIHRFRRLFDVGLHGPDIFLYHRMLLPTSVNALGSKYHQQTGREFFMRACHVARTEKSEAAAAYIYGVLCHYVLDSRCTPFISEKAKQGIAGYGEIEVEFDRFLLEMDGKCPPESQDLSQHLHLTPGECATVAKFYPPATPRQVQSSLHSMRTTLKRFAAPEGARRAVLRKILSIFGTHFQAMLMTTGPNPKCAQLDGLLLEHYQQAVAELPELLRQLYAHMTYNGMFGEEFTKIFG